MYFECERYLRLQELSGFKEFRSKINMERIESRRYTSRIRLTSSSKSTVGAPEETATRVGCSAAKGSVLRLTKA